MLDEAERSQLAGWARAPQPAASRWLPELLERQAAADPQRVVLRWAEGQWDSATLHRRANRLAHRLQALGVGPDVPVAIAAERSPELLVGLLAIIGRRRLCAAGRGLPRERLAYMLQDCGARLLLTQSHQIERLPIHEGVRVIELDREEGDWPDSPPTAAVHGDNLAYVIYTSGSTGQPKGVGNTHAALAERLAWMQAQYRLDASDVLLQKAPVSFDVSVWECFWPLVTEARLVLAAPASTATRAAWCSWCANTA